MLVAVFFDFDGTLVDSNAIKRQGYFDVVARHPQGTERMERILRQTPGDRRQVMAAYAGDCEGSGAARDDRVEQLVREYGEHVDARVVAAQEMPGATQLLMHLRKHHVRSFLSSATPASSLTRIVEQRGWLPLFDEIFGGPADKGETLRNVQNSRKIPAASLAVVGDGADDRASAASVGCMFFPVGEARGGRQGERVFTLADLQGVLLDRASV